MSTTNTSTMTDNSIMTDDSTMTDNSTMTVNLTINNSETSTNITTHEPMVASLSEYFEMDFAVAQLKYHEVDYKIDCETNTLKINYQGFEPNIVKMYEAIINNFMKKYPNYSNLWSN